MLRIGMLTSGGDCQALNAAMRGVVKGVCTKREDVEIYGFEDGYKGLIYGNFHMLTPRDFSGILTRGGTILGTSRQPFKLMRVPDKDGLDKVAAMKHTYHKLSLDCLVILGGNGTHKTANMLREEGLNVVTLPKTIDNDLWGTDMTFGFQSAVDIATDTIDRIHTTATSHSRVFIIEVMGHKVGHVTLHAGIAGGADVILLPEIPYDIDVVANVIQKRAAEGKKFTIIAVAEGAISKEDAKLKKKEYKEKLAKRKYPSIAYELAEEIQQKTDKEFAEDLTEWLSGEKIRTVILDPAAASFKTQLEKDGYKVKKAKNDVLDGIRLVATLLLTGSIFIDKSCDNLIKEFASYIWDAKAADKGEDKPVKEHDHALDALRYFCMTIIRMRPGIRILK